MVAPQNVEGRLEIRARPEAVFRALASPTGLNALLPGVEAAALGDMEAAVGSRLALRTHAGRVIDARIVERREARAVAVEDARGIRSEWRLLEIGNGRTLATNVVRGHFSDEEANALRMEQMARIMSLARAVEAKERARLGRHG